jgi:hypothetical protein
MDDAGGAEDLVVKIVAHPALADEVEEEAAGVVRVQLAGVARHPAGEVRLPADDHAADLDLLDGICVVYV